MDNSKIILPKKLLDAVENAEKTENKQTNEQGNDNIDYSKIVIPKKLLEAGEKAEKGQSVNDIDYSKIVLPKKLVEAAENAEKNENKIEHKEMDHSKIILPKKLLEAEEAQNKEDVFEFTNRNDKLGRVEIPEKMQKLAKEQDEKED